MDDDKQKKVLAIGSFAAKTCKYFLTQFTKESGEKRVCLAIEVEFTEGTNIGLHGTCIVSQDNMEFFHNTIIACGWAQGMKPTDIPTGKIVQAVVANDTNPRTNETKVIVKYINPIEGRKSVLAEKYGLDASATDAWNKQFLAASAQFIKSTGFSAPKEAPKPAQQTQQHSEVPPGGGDDIPF